MAGSELHFLTIADASRRIAQRELSPVELTETYLQRIAAIDNQLMSFVTLTAELARQRQPGAVGVQRFRRGRHAAIPPDRRPAVR
jgi:Asp-tRNA(Asn)/Glu-tRNA(Gln) amidotransferase A subunit family amidase